MARGKAAEGGGGETRAGSNPAFGTMKRPGEHGENPCSLFSFHGDEGGSSPLARDGRVRRRPWMATDFVVSAFGTIAIPKGNLAPRQVPFFRKKRPSGSFVARGIVSAYPRGSHQV